MADVIKEELVDIRDVMAEIEAEPDKTQEEKIISFVEKIKNPYAFKVGSVTVRVAFSGQMTMDDCFANFLATM